MKPCPKCGCREFRIEVTFSGTVDIKIHRNNPDEFEVTDSEPTDSEWNDNSGVSCMDCNWSGKMSDIESPN